MTGPSERRLYDPATRRQVGHRFARQIALIIGVSALVCGAMIGGLHTTELPFLATWLGYCEGGRYQAACEYPRMLDWLAGAGGGLAFGLVLMPLVSVAGRRVRPSVFCRQCDGMGWIPDLVRTSGRCPNCGCERFDYHQTELDPIYHPEGLLFLPRGALERDVTGTDLLRRGRARREAGVTR